MLQNNVMQDNPQISLSIELTIDKENSWWPYFGETVHIEVCGLPE